MKQAETPIVRDRRRQRIELSTVYWFNQELPPEVDIEACGLQGLAKGAFHAFYGVRGKQEGFVAARAHAMATGQDYTAIDLSVMMDQELPVNFVGRDDLATLDFLPIHRLTQGFADELDRRLRSDVGLSASAVGHEGMVNALQHTLRVRPTAVLTLLDYPEFEHVKVVVYQTKLPMSAEPMQVATIPERHLNSIVDARSRLDPDLIIRLHDARKGTAHSPDVLGVGSSQKPRGPRAK